MLEDGAILTRADQYQVVYDLWNGIIFNDLERLLTQISLFDAEYLKNGRDRRSYSEMQIGTYTRPTEGCHFE